MNLDGNSTFIENEGEINLNKCMRVKACIDNYLSQNPRLTLINVEDKTTVPHTTLRRIVSGKGNPQPEAVIKIYLSLGLDQELFQYMSDFHPEIANAMTSRSHNQDRNYVSHDDAYYFTDESSFLIMTLAYTTFGVSTEEIKEHLGLVGLNKLEELIKLGLIIKNENGIYVGKVEKYKLSFKDTYKRIEQAIKYYRLEEAGSDTCFMNLQTESLNDEGLKALKDFEVEKASQRKSLILNNKKYHGSRKIFIATISSTFMAKSDTKETLS